LVLYTDGTQQAYSENVSVTMKMQDEYISVGTLCVKSTVRQSNVSWVVGPGTAT